MTELASAAVGVDRQRPALRSIDLQRYAAEVGAPSADRGLNARDDLLIDVLVEDPGAAVDTLAGGTCRG